MRLVLLLLTSCGTPALDLRPSMRKLGVSIHHDVERDLAGWTIHASTLPGPVECGGRIDRSTGCTSIAYSLTEAWIRVTVLDGQALEDSPIVHELLHLWLASMRGDEDAYHTQPEWAPLPHDYVMRPLR